MFYGYGESIEEDYSKKADLTGHVFFSARQLLAY